MFLRYLLLGGVVYAATRLFRAKEKSGAPVGVRLASVDGREYEVFRRGGGTFEVVKRGSPETFVILGQTGEIDARGNATELATMRADMQKFPADLFA